jgi:hypothetical protein
MSVAIERGLSMARSWREGPRGILRFVADNFGVTLDAWQEEALVAFASPAPEHRRISLQACVGPGKSAVLAWCGWWFLGTQGARGEHPKGLATAITGENLRDNLWTEYAKWQGRSPYLRSQFTWTSRRIFANAHPETWFIAARSWPKTANAEEQGKTFSGLHAEYVLAQIDESGAIPATVLRAAEQALSRCVFGKIIQAGNPISLDGMLYAAANPLRHQWHVVRITGDPDDPRAWVNAPRVGDEPRKWAQLQIETHGRENPWVKSYILGQFPQASINALLGIEDVEAAMARELRPSDYEWQQKRLGVDVARFGDDRTVLFARQGLRTWQPAVMRNADTAEIAARVATVVARHAIDVTLVDDTGHWGHGVLDQLRVAGIPCIPLNYAAKAIDARYKNRRVEMWLRMADWVKRGGRLPDAPELIAELTTPTYTFAHGQFVLEEKDQVKKRLGRSPDLADALAETFAIDDMPRDHPLQVVGTANVGRAITDWDPYADDQDVERVRARRQFNPYEDRE